MLAFVAVDKDRAAMNHRMEEKWGATTKEAGAPHGAPLHERLLLRALYESLKPEA